MAFKYNISKVEDLLESYINLIKNEVPYKMYLTGGGDCPYINIEVVISKRNYLEFGIGDDDNVEGTGGKLYFSKQDLDTYETTEEILEKKKTKKAVKEFMLRIIKREINESYR